MPFSTRLAQAVQVIPLTCKVLSSVAISPPPILHGGIKMLKKKITPLGYNHFCNHSYPMNRLYSYLIGKNLITLFFYFLFNLIQTNLIMIKFYLRSEEHTSELQSRFDLVCRLLLEKKKNKYINKHYI